jgi:GTP-binding protein HflX
LTRVVRLPDAGEVLLTDTVGFIDRLPHALVAAFRATLEEVAEAGVLLHVIDASQPERDRQMAAVTRVLAEVGAETVEAIEVYNKIDALPSDECDALRARHPEGVFVSARTGTGVADLLARLAVVTGLDTVRLTLSYDVTDESDRARIAHLYRIGRVVTQRNRGRRTVVEADVPRRLSQRLIDDGLRSDSAAARTR